MEILAPFGILTGVFDEFLDLETSGGKSLAHLPIELTVIEGMVDGNDDGSPTAQAGQS